VEEITINSVKLSNEEKGHDVDGFFEPATVLGARSIVCANYASK